MGLTKAWIINEDSRERVECLFNPSEYSIAKTNVWQQKPIIGKNVPHLTFTGGESRTLSMDLFFDVFEKQNGDVRDHINKLWKLVLIDEGTRNPETHRARPPLCTFHWGPNWSFKAAVTSLSVRFTLFREDGTPVRARANITFKEGVDESEQPGTNPTSFSEPGRKRRLVNPDDTLAGIAYEEYGDPNRWRAIADDNGLDDPLAIKAGQVLSIPSLK